jgi:hypothetical protein
MSRTIKIIAGAVAALVVLVAIGIGVFLLMPTITSAMGASPTPTAASIASNTSTPSPSKAAVGKYIRQYSTNIEQQLAQGLKLTPDQLTTQLRSGQTLTQIATNQKVTGTQLNTVIATAVQNGLQPAVTAGNLTQKQVANLVKRFQKTPDQLGKLLVVQPRKKGTGTPTTQPTATP